MKRALFVLAMTLGATLTNAYAQTKLLVLHSDGKADPRVRQKIDGAIVKLARTGPDAVTPGEITYAEAAAMVGCKQEEASCRDEVIDTLGVDELLIVNVNPKPPGFEISVRRAKKGGAVHDTSTIVAGDKADQVGALGPVFGLKATTPAPVEPKPIGPQPIGPTPPDPKPADPKPADPKPIDLKPADPNPADQLPGIGQTDPTAKPGDGSVMRNDKQPKDRRRLQIAGMATGGGMMFLSFILWASASGVQGQIDEAPTRTRQDLLNLEDLENKGDSLANWGNFFFVGGLVLGGVSTYFYVKNRRAKRSKETTAWFAPTLFDHGAGVTFNVQGGAP